MQIHLYGKGAQGPFPEEHHPVNISKFTSWAVGTLHDIVENIN